MSSHCCVDVHARPTPSTIGGYRVSCLLGLDCVFSIYPPVGNILFESLNVRDEKFFNQNDGIICNALKLFELP